MIVVKESFVDDTVGCECKVSRGGCRCCCGDGAAVFGWRIGEECVAMNQLDGVV